MTRITTAFVTKLMAWLMVGSSVGLIGSLATPAYAALGQPYVATSNDQTSVKAALRATTSALYTQHTTQTSTGIEIHEYARADGVAKSVIFAVTWQGAFKPDLQTLLGNYFGKFRDAPRQTSVVQRHARLALPDLIVIQNGHMRAFDGKAWDPTLVPAGVVVEELP